MKINERKHVNHRENVLAAPAAATGGLKGIIAG